jgi:peptidoglycan hydrolase CwlO-like protein
MDFLSISAATIGISGAAITSIVGIRNTTNNIQDAKKVVGDIRTQLESIQKPLDSIKTLTVTNAGTFAQASKSHCSRASKSG